MSRTLALILVSLVTVPLLRAQTSPGKVDFYSGSHVREAGFEDSDGSRAQSAHSSLAASVGNPPVAQQAEESGNIGGLGEWKRNVEARYKAARNGSIEVLSPNRCKLGEAIVVKVFVNRPPEGSDGFRTAPVTGSATGVTGLLKVDDDMEVKLSSKEPDSFDIHSNDPRSRPVIRHILPGGWAEWTWTVKPSQPGEKHLVVTADVVYRRNFQQDGPPMLTFDSSTKVIAVQVQP